MRAFLILSIGLLLGAQCVLGQPLPLREDRAAIRDYPPLVPLTERNRDSIPQPRPFEPVKSQSDILYEKMAPWVFIEYHQDPRDPTAKWGKFLNTNRQTKTDWLRLGDRLEGAVIEGLNEDHATLRYGEASQKLLWVPETPPKYDPTRVRTPEEVAAAQRRYSEFYMKKFIVSGKEYNRRRGRLSTQPPPGAIVYPIPTPEPRPRHDRRPLEEWPLP
jgi:hypothetical protein